jgi:hypothetical protein
MFVERPMGGESTSRFDYKAMVTDRSVKAVEVMLVAESRLINKARGFAAARTAARTRAKMVERRILLVLREDQWRMW